MDQVRDIHGQGHQLVEDLLNDIENTVLSGTSPSIKLQYTDDMAREYLDRVENLVSVMEDGKPIKTEVLTRGLSLIIGALYNQRFKAKGQRGQL